MLTDGSILFNEVSPSARYRYGDNGLPASERVRAARPRDSRPADHPEHVSLTIPAGSVAASHAIVVAGDGEVEFTDVAAALAEPGTDLRILPSPKCMATAAWPWHWPSASPKPTPVPRPASWPMR